MCIKTNIITILLIFLVSSYFAPIIAASKNAKMAKMEKTIKQQKDSIDLLELKLQQSTKGNYMHTRNPQTTPSKDYTNTSYQGTNDLSYP